MIWVGNEIPAIELEDIVESSKGKFFPFARTTIVVTGKLKYFTRVSIHTEIESLRAKVGRTVSKHTDYLICGEKAGSKLSKAHLLGVKVLSEQEFLMMAQWS